MYYTIFYQYNIRMSRTLILILRQHSLLCLLMKYALTLLQRCKLIYSNFYVKGNLTCNSLISPFLYLTFGNFINTFSYIALLQKWQPDPAAWKVISCVKHFFNYLTKTVLLWLFFLTTEMGNVCILLCYIHSWEQALISIAHLFQM